MTPETGPFKGDSHPVGPAPQSRIDIYVLDVSQCRKRRDGCETIERTEALAVVIPAGPCDSAPGGPDTASGYVMVPLSDAPETAPSPTTASPSPFDSGARVLPPVPVLVEPARDGASL